MSVLIYSEILSPRLTYTIELIFDTILRIKHDITNDIEQFKLYKGTKICYHKSLEVKNALNIKAVDLLFEEDIYKHNLEVESRKNFKILFLTNNATFNYDPFAASFYLVSRYEEYLPSQLDKFKRYKAENSLAFQRNFLNIPVVNYFALDIAEELRQKFENFEFELPKHNFRVEIAINSLYAYKYKSPFVIIFDLLSLFFSFKWKKFWNRLQIHLDLKKDPFDTILDLKALEEKYNYKFNYLFNTRCISKIKFYPKKTKQYLDKLKNEERIGIVFHHGLNIKRGQRELNKFAVLAQPIKSRISMGKFVFPQSLEVLSELGIKEDYTLCYPDQMGFRASISTPFKAFNLKSNQKTDLTIYPVVLTDKLLKFHQKVRSTDVGYQVRTFNNIVKEVGGTTTVIFHNESMGKQKAWKNWGGVLESVLKSCVVK